MSATLNRDRTVAVDPDYYWQPMASCPLGVKVQLLGLGGVATYGIYIPSADPFWCGWAPLPKVRRPEPTGDTKGQAQGDKRSGSGGKGDAMLITSDDGFAS